MTMVTYYVTLSFEKSEGGDWVAKRQRSFRPRPLPSGRLSGLR
jgi:hypothetical protein